MGLQRPRVRALAIAKALTSLRFQTAKLVNNKLFPFHIY